MGLEIVAFILIASTWNITFDNTSYMLFIAAFLGGGVGGLQMVLVMPWMSRFKPACVTAFRVGTDIGSLLSATVALIQKPGTDGSRFSPTTYFSIFGSLMLLPVAAYITILSGDYGIRDKVDVETINNDHEKGDTSTSTNTKEMIGWGEAEVNIVEMTVNPLSKATGKASTTKIKNAISMSATSEMEEAVSTSTFTELKKSTSTPRDTSCFKGVLLSIDDKLEKWEKSFLKNAYSFVTWCFPSLSADKVPWLSIVMPYMMTITWVDFNIFGFIFGVFPLAMKNATLIFTVKDTGDSYTQQAFMGYSLQLATITYLIGDLITFFYLFKIRYILIYFTIACSIIYILGTSAFDGTIDENNMITSEAVAPMLVFLYCTINFCAPYLLCVCFREACSKPAVNDRESSARTLGLFDQASTVIGSVTLILILGKSSSCH
jgi:hypothetical protein